MMHAIISGCSGAIAMKLTVCKKKKNKLKNSGGNKLL